MRRLLSTVIACATCIGALATFGGAATAKAPPCPTAYELADLPELEAFVEAAGGTVGGELTDYFELVDANDDGLICFKALPEATPLPTPPLLSGDNKLPKEK